MPAHVLVTRNLKAYKELLTYIAGIQRRLYTLLQTRADLRRCFACCLSPSSNSAVDEQLARYFLEPPHIALIQGLADPSSIDRSARLADGVGAGGKRAASLMSSDSASIQTVSTNGTSWTKNLAPDGVDDLIFIAWSIHAGLETARRDGDSKARAEACMLALASLIYETAHWLFEKEHEHLPQASLRSLVASGVEVTEMESVTAQRKASDVGFRVLSLLLGADIELLIFADGNSCLVKQRLPAPHPPLITLSPCRIARCRGGAGNSRHHGVWTESGGHGAALGQHGVAYSEGGDGRRSLPSWQMCDMSWPAEVASQRWRWRKV